MHYCLGFTNKVLNGLNIGHICPKYALDFLNEDLVKQMINKTVPKPKKALLDWKGMNKEQRDKVVSLLENQNIIYEKFR